MTVSPRAVAVAADGAHHVLLSICPSNATDRLPCDMCVVVDVSGSMQQEAVVKAAQEAGAPQRPSVLDIVKHAVKTVVHTLGPGDRLAIVAYSDKASTPLQLSLMTDAGKTSAEEALKSLHADGQTNLWDGLKTGLDLLKAEQRPGASAALLLLTDGVPNVEPAGGHLPSLREYRSSQGGKLAGTLHTFGFGEDLDSKLLSELACEGDGMYVFIPDASFVGTALVNCMANTLVTMGRNVQLTVEPCEGCSVEHLYGHKGRPRPRDPPRLHHRPRGDQQRLDPQKRLAPWVTDMGAAQLVVPLGPLQYGQSTDVVLRVAAPAGHSGPFVRAGLRYDGPDGAAEVPFPDAQVVAAGSAEGAELDAQLARLRFAELVGQLLELADASEGGLADALCAAEDFSKSLALGEPKVDALKQDVDGQVCEAVSRKDWYKSWGAHYLRSLGRAHLLQQCNNFKDPGVQVYGGELFDGVRERADDTFLSLPPPSQQEVGHAQTLMAMGFAEADVLRALEAASQDMDTAVGYLMDGRIPTAPRGPTRRQAAPAPARPAPAYSMHDYYNSAGPCFSGSSPVELADGGRRPFAELKRGDLVATGSGGESARVVCLVETWTRSGEALLVKVGREEEEEEAEATPWHPVQTVSGEWAFPADLGEPSLRPCPAVYNVVLDRGHTLVVGGVRTVSLGHGFEGGVLGHRFWGGPAVLECLQQFRGWTEGKVCLGPGCVLRDEHGQACGLSQDAFGEAKA